MNTILQNKRNLIILIILLAGLPVLFLLARQTQIFQPRATNPPIVFTGPNLTTVGGKQVLTKPEVGLQLTSQIGPPGGTITASSSARPSASPQR